VGESVQIDRPSEVAVSLLCPDRVRETVSRAAIALRRRTMSTYVVLVNFTDQGIRTIGDSPKRYEAFKTLAEKLDVQIKSTFWTVGPYDIVTTLEGADEAVTAALLKLGSLGNVRTHSLRAFSADEFGRIVKRLP
jgi:uncharacterized protein with GYD domain